MDDRPARRRAVAGALALVALAGAAAVIAATLSSSDGDDAADATGARAAGPPPTSEAVDATGELADALAARLAAEGVEPGDAQLRCLAQATLGVLDGPVDADRELSAPEERALVRAVVECLDPADAAALLGDGAPAEAPPSRLPDEG